MGRNMNYGRSHTIDGYSAAFLMYENDFERKMWYTYGYPLKPKNGIEVITKQDLIDHPDWFEPFEFTRCTGSSLTFEETMPSIYYKDGKWLVNSPIYPNGDKSRPGCYMKPPTLDASEDVSDMKKYYPELYRDLLKLNRLEEDETSGELKPISKSPVTPQQGKPHTSKPAPAAPKQDPPEESPKSTISTNYDDDDIKNMWRTLIDVIKVKSASKFDADYAEAERLMEELINILWGSSNTVEADGNVEINYTYISESLDFNNVAAGI